MDVCSKNISSVEGLFEYDVHLSQDISPVSRLGPCEVCCAKPANYTCPACEVKSCSLKCCQIHKKELACSGHRNRVKYKPLSHFTNLDLQNDYRLLEELGRSIETISKTRKIQQRNLKLKWHKLRWRAQKKGIHLQFLPPNFQRHLENTTYHSWNDNSISWRVEWIFNKGTGDHIQLISHRVAESCLMKEALLECIGSNNSTFDSCGFIENGNLSDDVRLLMKAEKIKGNKYILIDLNSTLGDTLQGKVIIEFPKFNVILIHQLQHYTIIKADNESIAREVNNSGFQMRPKNSLKFFSDAWSNSSEESN